MQTSEPTNIWHTVTVGNLEALAAKVGGLAYLCPATPDRGYIAIGAATARVGDFIIVSPDGVVTVYRMSAS